jgi:hypothetical protein
MFSFVIEERMVPVAPNGSDSQSPCGLENYVPGLGSDGGKRTLTSHLSLGV